MATTTRPDRTTLTEAGTAARLRLPLADQGNWKPAADRPDPIALLEEQAQTRLPELVPIRYGRMSVSPFAFYRGAALPMAADLAAIPNSGLTVQLCGVGGHECHNVWRTEMAPTSAAAACSDELQ